MNGTRISKWVPQDPVEWEYSEDEEEFTLSSPVYSERDQAEYNRLLALDLEEAHRDRMRELMMRWSSYTENMNLMLEEMRQTILAARANDAWDYVAAEDGGMQKRDDTSFDRVQMEARVFGASRVLSRVDLFRPTFSTELEMQEMVLGELSYHLSAHVYGATHTPITSRATKRVEFEVPDGWWQTFKSERKWKHRTRIEAKTVEMAVSADRFSAFPELPYKPDPRWGPRIDLVLQRPIDWKEY